jgi:hypothetical protein
MLRSPAVIRMLANTFHVHFKLSVSGTGFIFKFSLVFKLEVEFTLPKGKSHLFCHVLLLLRQQEREFIS